MKKILIITLEYPPQIGGVQNYVHQFASALIPEQVVVLAPRIKGAEEFDRSQKFKTIRKYLLFPFFIWPRWLKLFFQVLAIVKKERINIIYLHHVLPVGYVAWLIKKIKKIPYLVFSHGTDIEAGTKNFWKKKMFQIVAESSEQIIFNSNSLRRRFLAKLPEFEDISAVIYPCPENIFYQIPRPETIAELKAHYALEGKKVMLSVSRLAEGKGLTHLLRILPKILEKVPNLVWLVIGEGPKKEFLLTEIQKNYLQNAVRFIGEVPHDQLNNFYHLADLFVLLTHPDEGREEGLGLVFLEAAAAGVPAVAGKSGGVEEGVLNGETGIIVDIYRGDKMVVDNIVEMFNNVKFAQKLADNAQMRMENEFVWKKQLQVITQWL